MGRLKVLEFGGKYVGTKMKDVLKKILRKLVEELKVFLDITSELEMQKVKLFLQKLSLKKVVPSKQ